LGRREDGLKSLQEAKTLLNSMEENQLVTVYLANCEDAIKAVQGMQQAESTSRAWWEFWK
jgi:hypothetical protein